MLLSILLATPGVLEPRWVGAPVPGNLRKSERLLAHSLWVSQPAEVEEPELDYPSWVPLVMGPSSGHFTSCKVLYAHGWATTCDRRPERSLSRQRLGASEDWRLGGSFTEKKNHLLVGIGIDPPFGAHNCHVETQQS